MMKTFLNNNTTMRNYPELIEEFIFYVNSFYNDQDGIYPIATKERIKEAVNIYLESKPLGEIYFDSIDRESVRLILEPTYSLWIPLNHFKNQEL